VLWLGLLPLAANAVIPPIPKDHAFIQDYAGIVPAETRTHIGRIQERAFASNDTPIMVVTIRSMADYGFAGSTIEQFAQQWFNSWQIGKRSPDGQLINRGILLLVSVGDRKARIELGADWGHEADTYAADIMDNTIVPAFKQGNFAQGIHNGVAALADLAAAGPGAIPEKRITDTVVGWVEDAAGPGQVSTSPLPKHLILGTTAIGVILIGLSFIFPSQRKLLLCLGIGLIVAAWLTWAVIIILALFAKGKGRSGGGFSSSGGFGSGGFSGGGGASGKW
jgi:uncharacterized protein